MVPLVDLGGQEGDGKGNGGSGAYCETVRMGARAKGTGYGKEKGPGYVEAFRAWETAERDPAVGAEG